MTETKTNNLEFVKYRLTWKFTDEGENQVSVFFLPKGTDPHGLMGAVLSVVELSASEYGYQYDITAECWRLDDDHIITLQEENNDDGANAYANKCVWMKTCSTCFWGDGDSCTKTQDGELVELAKDDRELTRSTVPSTITRESLDAQWADLRKRIRESDEPIKVTGLIGNLGKSDDEKVPSDSDLLGW